MDILNLEKFRRRIPVSFEIVQDGVTVMKEYELRSMTLGQMADGLETELKGREGLEKFVQSCSNIPAEHLRFCDFGQLATMAAAITGVDVANVRAAADTGKK